MIKIYPYEQLGYANHGWLEARHHFSFAGYRNKERMNFGALRVINDDRIEAGQGFGTHPHENMEIITYVKKGAISHKDSLNNEGRTKAGDVQVMSAGTGVFHSEFNAENIDTELYQIWITPNEQNVHPRWKAKEFPKAPVASKLAVLVSGQAAHAGGDALFIHQDAAIYGGRMEKGASISQAIKHQAYILVSAGEISIGGEVLKKGDGAEITGESEFSITALSDSEVLVIDAPR